MNERDKNFFDNLEKSTTALMKEKLDLSKAGEADEPIEVVLCDRILTLISRIHEDDKLIKEMAEALEPYTYGWRMGGEILRRPDPKVIQVLNKFKEWK